MLGLAAIFVLVGLTSWACLHLINKP